VVDQSKSVLQHIDGKLNYLGKAIHPELVANYKHKQNFKIPQQGDAKHYGLLTDESTFAEYAWEFLRRNRFYQAMIDNVKPSFNLDEWGYSAAPCYVSSCGLAEPYKHYAENYKENKEPEWAPLWAIETRMQETLKSKKFARLDIEYPGLQIPFVFDVASVFGPGSIGLQTQADLAVKLIQQQLELRKVQKNTDSEAGLVNRPGKPRLRMLLRLADLMSYPQRTESDGDVPTPKNGSKPAMINATQAASLLESFNFDDAGDPSDPKIKLSRANITYDRVEKARAFIYEWWCLSLLTFSKQEAEPLRKGKIVAKKAQVEN